MKIRKFRSKTAGDALEAVRRELGDDALVLSTKQVPDRDAHSRGERVEVVAAIDWEDACLEGARPSSIRDQPPADGTAVPMTSAPDVGKEREPLDNVEERLDALRRVVFQLIASAPAPEEFALDTVYRTVYTEMIANDVDAVLAARVLKAVKDTLRVDEGHEEVSDAVQSTIESILPVRRSGHRRLSVLVGPTGVGKTTTAAKLAAGQILHRARNVTLATSDTYRVAGADQLRAYASAMGARFELVRNVSELDALMSRADDGTSVILDTEGRGQRDLDGLAPWFDYLSERQDVERHLVLSATTKPADLRETVEEFGRVKPETLIFTRVDETNSYGPIVSQSVRSGLPVSYLGTGQRVPEEILAATPQTVAELAVSSLS